MTEARHSNMEQGIRQGSHKLSVKQDEKWGSSQPQASSPLRSYKCCGSRFQYCLIPCLPDSSLRAASRSCCLGRFLLLVTTHLIGDLFCFLSQWSFSEGDTGPNAMELGKENHKERCLNQLSYLQVVELMGGLTSKTGELLKAKSPGAGVRGEIETSVAEKERIFQAYCSEWKVNAFHLLLGYIRKKWRNGTV